MRWIIIIGLLLLVACTAPEVVEEPVVEEPQEEPVEEVVETTEEAPEEPAETSEESTEESTETTEEEPVESETAETESTEGGIDPEALEIAEQYYKPIERAGIYPASKEMQSGETYVFAVVIANKVSIDDTFRINVDFVSAKDNSQGAISEDDDFAQAWVENSQFVDIPIERNGKVTVPLEVNVGPTNDGEEPIPGSYKFRVSILHADGEGPADNSYVRKDLNIRIPKE